MRNIVKYILKNLIAGHITDADAIKQLQVLFANSKYLSDEKNMLPIGKKRLHKIIAADGDKCFYCGVKTYRHGNDRKEGAVQSAACRVGHEK